MPTFRKRTFTLSLLARSLLGAALYLPVLLVALLRPTTSRALREKVMLAVSAVNDCRYCNWVHTGLALANGVDLDDLKHVLEADTFGEVNGRDATAILFARHFADTVRRPHAEARTALAREFSFGERLEIMAYINAIYFANLSGNSGDAWLARLRGLRVDDGHPLAEAIAALAAAPFLLLIAALSRKSRRPKLDAL